MPKKFSSLNNIIDVYSTHETNPKPVAKATRLASAKKKKLEDEENDSDQVDNENEASSEENVSDNENSESKNTKAKKKKRVSAKNSTLLAKAKKRKGTKNSKKNNDEDNEEEENEENNDEPVQDTELEEKLRENIQQYVKVDNRIKKYNDKIKLLRDSIKPYTEKKKKLEKRVAAKMKNLNLYTIKIDDGDLKLNSKKSVEPLKPEYILKILNKVFPDDTKKIKKAYKYLIDKRPSTDEYVIKRLQTKSTYNKFSKKK